VKDHQVLPQSTRSVQKKRDVHKENAASGAAVLCCAVACAGIFPLSNLLGKGFQNFLPLTISHMVT
jgi:hypothetical protein